MNTPFSTNNTTLSFDSLKDDILDNLTITQKEQLLEKFLKDSMKLASGNSALRISHKIMEIMPESEFHKLLVEFFNLRFSGTLNEKALTLSAYAIKLEMIDLLKVTLKYVTNINEFLPEDKRNTLLLLAAGSSSEVLQNILNYRPDVNKTDKINTRSPLMVSTDKENSNFSMLLQAGAEPKHENYVGHDVRSILNASDNTSEHHERCLAELQEYL